jgi:copper chaperone CopZ
MIKRILLIASCVSIYGYGSVYAQKTDKKPGNKQPQTVTFAVMGNCGKCKATIESALKTKGVKKAVWNVNEKTVSVTYIPALIKEEDLHQRIAAAGYDTEKAKAPAAAYDKLPACCKYRK